MTLTDDTAELDVTQTDLAAGAPLLSCKGVEVFVATVIGGLTSLPGAVVGTVVIKGISLFGEPRLEGLSFLVTGPGLLLVLLFLPGGFAQAIYATRDRFLRWVAARHDIHVPSLVADRLVADTSDQEHIMEEAEESVEHVETFADVEQRLSCPVCGALLTLEQAAEHEHLRAPETVGAGQGGAR